MGFGGMQCRTLSQRRVCTEVPQESEAEARSGRSSSASQVPCERDILALMMVYIGVEICELLGGTVNSQLQLSLKLTMQGRAQPRCGQQQSFGNLGGSLLSLALK
jgi:hypothetical protein